MRTWSGIAGRRGWRRSTRKPDVRTLVTGAGGFAGQHLIRELLGRGAEVVGGVFTGEPPAPGVLSAEEITRVRWTSLDVTSSASLRRALEEATPRRVYHLAGQSSVGGSFADPMGTWDVNATGTLRLLEALREHAARADERGGTVGSRAAAGPSGDPGAAETSSTADGPVRVLVVSSAEVYGAVPEARQPISEDEPLRPITPYGASKMAAEAAAFQAAASGGLHVVVSRSFNHAGPGQDERFALPSMARQLVAFAEAAGSGSSGGVGGGTTGGTMAGANGAASREPDGGASGAASAGNPSLRVGNLEPLRDFLDVRDVARAYIALVERGRSGQVYNVASGVARTMMEVVQELVRASGTGAVIERDPARFRPVDIPLMVGDPTRLRSLGWQPEIPLERTVRDLLDSVRGIEVGAR